MNPFMKIMSWLDPAWYERRLKKLELLAALELENEAHKETYMEKASVPPAWLAELIEQHMRRTGRNVAIGYDGVESWGDVKDWLTALLEGSKRISGSNCPTCNTVLEDWQMEQVKRIEEDRIRENRIGSTNSEKGEVTSLTEAQRFTIRLLVDLFNGSAVASYSIMLAMPSTVKVANEFFVKREALGLSGWLTDEEAFDAIARHLFGLR